MTGRTQEEAPSSALLTPLEAARLVGVSESTVRRWCDRDLVPTARTTGRHRRIHQGDLLAFARAAGLWRHGSDPVSTSGRGGRSASAGVLAERLQGSLEALDLDGVQTFVREWFTRGGEPEALFDEVLSPAMRALGDRWEAGHLAIYQEHHATQLVLAALSAVPPYLPTVPVGAPVAICAALSGDPYAIAPQMSALVAQAEGYRSILLGPDTPAEEIAAAARATGATLVCVSISVAVDVDAVRADVRRLAAAAKENAAALAIGGRAIDPSMRRELAADGVGESMADLRAFARERRGGRALREERGLEERDT